MQKKALVAGRLEDDTRLYFSVFTFVAGPGLSDCDHANASKAWAGWGAAAAY